MGVDEEIIKELKENSRKSFSEIGRKLDLTEGAIRKRVSNLVDSGAIKRFTIETAGNNAIIGVQTDPQILTKTIVENLKKLNISKTFETTGRYDLFCIINSKNSEDVNNMLEKIRTTKGVIGTETFSVLKET